MSVLPDPDNPMYSVEAVAKMFGVKPYTVRQWIKDGTVEANKVLGRWRVQRSELVKLANKEHG